MWHTSSSALDVWCLLYYHVLNKNMRKFDVVQVWHGTYQVKYKMVCVKYKSIQRGGINYEEGNEAEQAYRTINSVIVEQAGEHEHKHSGILDRFEKAVAVSMADPSSPEQRGSSSEFSIY